MKMDRIQGRGQRIIHGQIKNVDKQKRKPWDGDKGREEK